MKPLIMKHRHDVELLRLDDEHDIHMWRLDDFAHEFGHRVHRVFPIFIVLVDGTLSAYYYAQPHVCIYPAVHPERFTPRSFYEVAKTIVAASKRSFGNPLWMIGEDTPFLTTELLEKIHLHRSPTTVYEVP